MRGAYGEDISTFVSKVAFKLHPSFPRPEHVVTQAPFRIDEVGWGEFVITCSVYFHDSAGEDPVVILHGLKLYPPAPEPPSSRPVVHETFDEVTFTAPRPAFYARLQAPRLMPSGACHEAAFSEPATLTRLDTALSAVTAARDSKQSQVEMLERQQQALRRALAAKEREAAKGGSAGDAAAGANAAMDASGVVDPMPPAAVDAGDAMDVA